MGSIFGKAKKGFGKALKPRGPGVIRPKPTDRYGQQMKPKPIRPGKKDGGKAKKFPDLTGVGKVTRADVLKGRGVFASGGRPGLYANIHAKRKRGGKMKKKGAKGAPTAANFRRAAQTARKK